LASDRPWLSWPPTAGLKLWTPVVFCALTGVLGPLEEVGLYEVRGVNWTVPLAAPLGWPWGDCIHYQNGAIMSLAEMAYSVFFIQQQDISSNRILSIWCRIVILILLRIRTAAVRPGAREAFPRSASLPARHAARRSHSSHSMASPNST
jgi:hypothetical protein